MNSGEPPGPDQSAPAQKGTSPAVFSSPKLRIFDIQLYRACDQLTELLICFLLIGSPWAFGTPDTLPAVVRTMNWIAYTLGLLLLVKEVIRHFRGYQPPRWGLDTPAPLRWLTRTLALLTIAVLGYCLASALNARSTWQTQANTFGYHEFISWLPHSYERASTWRVFWNYLALACAFWAIRNWLLGQTPAEESAERRLARGAAPSKDGESSLLPGRLRRLLWVLCLNGALLGLEGIVQRLSGTGKLLWLIEPRVNKDGLSQFGPFAYRASAAQYFNLLWPVCLGFWWTLHRTRGFKRWFHHVLLLAGIIMAACPVIATTRGGAIIAFVLILLSALFLALSPIFLSSRRWQSPMSGLATFLVVCGFFVGAVALAIQLGWGDLEWRMLEAERGFEERERIFETARKMADEYRWYGTGPGTFNALFQLYRTSVDEYWPAQLHNDWLETRITFGRIGTAMLLASLAIVLARWFVMGGIHGGRRLVVLIWFALAGCLIHARFDFPLQMYSILLLFLTLCAVLFTLSRRGG